MKLTRSPFAASCHDRIAPVLLCGHMCIVKLHFVKFSRKFGQILSKFDQIWSNFENLGKFEAFWKFVKCVDFCGFWNLWICGQIFVKFWSKLFKFSLIGSNSVKSGHIWSNLGNLKIWKKWPKWAKIVRGDP